MYIATVPNRHSPPAILLRESFREGGTVRTRTLANLTSWAPERIEALHRALKGEFDGLSGDLPPTCGPICAVLFVLKQLADRLGLTRVLGKGRRAKLALLLVLVRIAAHRAAQRCGGLRITPWRRRGGWGASTKMTSRPPWLH